VLEVIKREKLGENSRNMGEFLKARLEELSRTYPGVIKAVRGFGLMLGFELEPNIARLAGDPSKPQAVRFVQLLHAQGVLAIPAGTQVVRLLPPLNLSKGEAEQGLNAIAQVCNASS
jgi:acetylornithine/succinyldiaminopimelate/putrescine aminotransferase